MEANDRKEVGAASGDLACSAMKAVNNSQERPDSWQEYFASAPRASSDFMENVEELPQQERAMWKDAESE